jgi:hypothetical protein
VHAVEGSDNFVTALGWRIHLQRVLLSSGRFDYFDGAPSLASNSKPRLRQYALALFGIGTAHAHPGHYQAGNVLGQMLQPTTFDLFAGTTRLADGEGITGVYRSARFSFHTPQGSKFGDELGPHVALLQGSAAAEGQDTRYFQLDVPLAAIERSAAKGRVDGCVFDEVTVDADGTVSVEIDPVVWFELVDFSDVEPGSKASPIVLAEDSQPAIAITQGLSQLSAYHFTYRN